MMILAGNSHPNRHLHAAGWDMVLAQDPLGIPATRLDDLQVLSTWVDGRPGYRSIDRK